MSMIKTINSASALLKTQKSINEATAEALENITEEIIKAPVSDIIVFKREGLIGYLKWKVDWKKK